MIDRLDLENAQYKWHKRRHRDARNITVDRCWWCKRSAANCRSKIRHKDRDAATEWALEFGISRNFSEVQVPYWCIWCGHYHTTTPNSDAERREAERARRGWLISQNARTA